VSYGHQTDLDFTVPAARPFIHLVLPMFFGLSGFLVSGSLERSRTLVSFFGLGTLRIVPALSVDVVLSALLLGPLLTDYSLAHYVTDPEFRRYFLNILGDIHFTLPGLFLHNPRPATVNGQLWTIPAELQCYALLGALAVAGIVRRRVILLIAVVAGQALWVWVGLHRPTTLTEIHNGANVATLVLSFVTGVTFYAWRDRVQLNLPTFLIAAAAAMILGFVPSGALYLPLPAVYVTLFLGFLNPPRTWVVRSGDYSYGIYLYGFPIQQTIAMLPILREWYLSLAIAWPAAFALAFLSWHFVEKPVGRWRSVLPRIEAWISSLLLGGSTAITDRSLDHGASPSLRWLAYLVLGLVPLGLMVDLSGQAGVLASLVVFAVATVDLSRSTSRNPRREAKP